jgi:brefeldin A-inhibited guanine nucleotide-exchange protein
METHSQEVAGSQSSQSEQSEQHVDTQSHQLPNEQEDGAEPEMESTLTVITKEQQENTVSNGHISASKSMQEIPLDSPTPEEPPVVPIKSPTSPRADTPRSQTFTPRNSLSTVGSSRHHRSLTLSRGQTVSSVLITSALDTILDSREAKRSTTLRDATQRALDMINAENDELIDSRLLFEPLRLACETRSEKLMVASLDCISKLISYNFFNESTPPQHDTLPLPDLIVHTVTSAYSEATSDAVSLQIVKSLLALVLSTSIVVHHSSLLKAVRTIYNVFLLSQNSSNQLVAQGGLTQIIHHVFSRCKANKSSGQLEEDFVGERPPLSPSKSLALSSPISGAALVESVEVEKRHLPDDAADTSIGTPVQNGIQVSDELEHQQSDRSGTATINLSATPPPDDLDTERVVRDLTPRDMFIKDAYLVFRALCKLSMKPLITERYFFLHFFLSSHLVSEPASETSNLRACGQNYCPYTCSIRFSVLTCQSSWNQLHSYTRGLRARLHYFLKQPSNIYAWQLVEMP